MAKNKKIDLVASFPTLFESIVQHEDRIICDFLYVYDAKDLSLKGEIEYDDPVNKTVKGHLGSMDLEASCMTPFFDDQLLLGHKQLGATSILRWD